jgi:lambda family phage portal protein
MSEFIVSSQFASPAVTRLKPVTPVDVIPKRRNIRAGMLDSTAPGEDGNYWKYAVNSHADEIANSGERQKARARCRYQYLNDGYCRNIVRSFSMSVIGDGAWLQLYDDNKEINQSVENKFAQWCYETKIAEKLDLAIKSLMFDGESFLRFVYDITIDCGLNVAIIDSERVGSGWMGYDDQQTLDGIRYNKYGHPAEYYIFEHVPNPNYNRKYIPEKVPAFEVIHFYIPDLPEQHRGLPLLLSVLKDFSALRRYRVAVIEAAETAASASIVIKTQRLPDTDEPENMEAFDQVILPRRGGLSLPRGWDAQQLKPEQPAASHSDFMNVVLTGIGAGTGQPRNVVTNDSSNYNFSSAKLDHQLYYRYIKTVQLRIKHLYDRIFEMWVRANCDNADIALLYEKAGRDEKKIKRDWFFTELEEIDPKTEIDAMEKKIGLGLTTRSEYYARKGQDPETQMERWINEQKRLSNQEPVPEKETVEKIETEKPTEKPEQKTEPQPKGSADDPENIQATAMNGAQVTSAVDIVTKVATGELPAESAVVMLVNFFQLNDSVARAMIEPAKQLYETKKQTVTQVNNNEQNITTSEGQAVNN